MIDTSKPFTTQDLIHDNTIIVDLEFIDRDKQYILDRVQYWKNHIKEHGYRTVLVASNPTIDTIAIFFAAAELGVVIATSNLADGPEAFIRRSDTSEMNYINPFFSSSWFDPRDIKGSPIGHLPVFVLDEKVITKDFESNRPLYSPDLIHPEANLITGEVTGIPDSRVMHTADRFMHAGLLCVPMYNTSDRFGAVNGITHIGLLSQVVLGPLFAGVKFYTINGFYDLLFMACRNLFTKVFFYDVHLKLTDWHPNFSIPINAFKNCTIFCAGSIPSPRLMDVVFDAGADKIVSCYGTFLAVGPVFELEIDNVQFDVYNSNLGRVYDETQVKIVDDQLWIKTSSQSKYIKDVDADGFFNTFDYVSLTDGVYKYLGRERRFTASGKKVFTVDIQNAVQSALDEDLYYSEYMFEEQPSCIEFYPLSKRAKDVMVRNKDNLLSVLQNILENTGITEIKINPLVNDANLFAGRIILSRIKQLINDGHTIND
jgi:hypothetical protein